MIRGGGLPTVILRESRCTRSATGHQGSLLRKRAALLSGWAENLSEDRQMSDRTCERCRFWHREETTDQNGSCRKNPPAWSNLGQRRPTTMANNFCGEWRDNSITPEQEQRAELVTRFALAIVASDRDAVGGRWKPAAIWRMAEDYVDGRPKSGGE